MERENTKDIPIITDEIQNDTDEILKPIAKFFNVIKLKSFDNIGDNTNDSKDKSDEDDESDNPTETIKNAVGELLGCFIDKEKCSESINNITDSVEKFATLLTDEMEKVKETDFNLNNFIDLVCREEAEREFLKNLIAETDEDKRYQVLESYLETNPELSKYVKLIKTVNDEEKCSVNVCPVNTTNETSKECPMKNCPAFQGCPVLSERIISRDNIDVLVTRFRNIQHQINCLSLENQVEFWKRYNDFSNIQNLTNSISDLSERIDDLSIEISSIKNRL